MKILKKLPRWAIVAIAIVLAAFMAITVVQHFAARHRVKEQRDMIWQQYSFSQAYDAFSD